MLPRPPVPVRSLPRKPPGRGARSNHAGRYEADCREAEDDGWGPQEAPAPHTEVGRDASRRVITRNASPDVGFDRSINPYRGCEHGCVYCFARPTHAYLGLSPGLDFETRLFAKPEAASLLARELAAPAYVVKPIALGTNTDPYQPIERRLAITRSVLEVLWRHRHPFSITTKSAGVLRDLDILAPAAEAGLAKVALSITTLDSRLARAMEPRASSPARRLEAVRELAAAGVPTMVMAAPVIPGLSDHELEAILAAGAEAGARAAGFILLRLPLEVRDLFIEWLESTVPERAGRVMSLLRQMRGGRDNDPRWGTRMTGEGPYAALLQKRFEAALSRLGLSARLGTLDVTQFRRPAAASGQLDLFG